MEIQGIITHPRPHLDEIVAMWLFLVFGESKYPGIAELIIDRKIRFQRMKNLAEAQEYEAEGYILLGVGGGQFDEHPTSDNGGRKLNECVATLVAKHLGVEDLPELQKILAYTLSDDLGGGRDMFSFTSIVKAMNNQFPDDPSRVIDWAFDALDTIHEDQRQFHVVARQEFEKKAKVEEFYAPGRKLKLVTITTDSVNVAKYALSEFGAQAQIVIQKNTRGQVQILTDKKRNRVDLGECVYQLSVAEQQHSGRPVIRERFVIEEGSVPGAENWYFFEKLRCLLNGSHSNPDEIPTTIPLDRIQYIIKNYAR